MANIEQSRLQLQEHQEEAYENVEKLFENGRYAAVIFPTGCGKSFVTLEYMIKHPDEKVLILSPKNAIKDQMYEYVVRYIGGLDLSAEEIKKQYGSMKQAAKEFIPNIECMLYQTILKMGENENLEKVLEKLNPDLIVVDEVHHLKTKTNDLVEDEENNNIKKENEWGRKIKELLERYPNAKVLGLSATPIRSDNVNVVERLFQNRVALELSLLEAIEAGIIMPPQYVTPDFIVKDELETLLERIDETEGEEKILLKEKYDKLVEKSSMAKGIPELLGSEITKKDGKYIIFCRDIKDMEEKAKKAKEWFEKVDKEPEIYMISSKQRDSKEQLNRFNESNSEHIKLLYSVGMINEGVHLDKISGVILTSKTQSRISYLQKIGRAIYSGNEKEQAVVIDLANNNEILYKNQDLDEIYQYEIRDIEALREAIDWINDKNEGKIPKSEKDKSFKERIEYKRLARIKEKYQKYINNPELLEKLSNEKQEEVKKIIEEGNTIDLWNLELSVDKENEETNKEIDNFLENITIKGIRIELEDILQEANESIIPLKLKQAIKIKEWMENHNNKQPSTKSKNEEERALGRALDNIRQSLIKPYEALETEEKKKEFIKMRPEAEKVKEIIDWIDANRISVYLENAIKIKAWMQERNTTKPPSSKAKDDEERKLGQALGSIRRLCIKPYKNLNTEEEKKQYKKEHPDLEKIMEIVNYIDKNNISPYLINAIEIKKWMEKENTKVPPRVIGKNLGEEEKKWGRKLHKIRSELLAPYSKLKTEEEKQKFVKKYPDLEEIENIIKEIDMNNPKREMLEKSKRTRDEARRKKEEAIALQEQTRKAIEENEKI